MKFNLCSKFLYFCNTFSVWIFIKQLQMYETQFVSQYVLSTEIFLFYWTTLRFHWDFTGLRFASYFAEEAYQQSCDFKGNLISVYCLSLFQNLRLYTFFASDEQCSRYFQDDNLCFEMHQKFIRFWIEIISRVFISCFLYDCCMFI